MRIFATAAAVIYKNIEKILCILTSQSTKKWLKFSAKHKKKSNQTLQIYKLYFVVKITAKKMMLKQQNKKFNLIQRVNNNDNNKIHIKHYTNITLNIHGINSTTQIFTTLNKHQYITTKFNIKSWVPPDESIRWSTAFNTGKFKPYQP